MVRLENWSILYDDKNDARYAPPEELFICLSGIVYGHPKFEDGEPVKTGRLTRYKEGLFMTINGTKYFLGNVNSEYGNRFPEAYNRLIATLETYFGKTTSIGN